jgi:hypothetical protein
MRHAITVVAALAIVALGAPSARAQITNPTDPDPTETVPDPANPTDPVPPEPAPNPTVNPTPVPEPTTTPDTTTTTTPDTTTTTTTTTPTPTPVTTTPEMSTPVVVAPTVIAEQPEHGGDAWTRLTQDYGFGAFVGGGVAGFSDEDMRDVTGAAGTWSLRLGLGINMPVGVEAIYQGGIQNIDALGLDSDARLLSTTVEGDLHINFLPGAIQPYAFGGVGWTRYSLNNVSKNTSDLNDDDDVLTIPLGVGVQGHWNHVLLDLRGTYRVATYEDLVPTTGTTAADLSTWGVSAQAGFEF